MEYSAMKNQMMWKWGWIAEFLLAGLILFGLCKVVIFFYSAGYLPPPFFDESSDTFMDWYNTTYWAHRPGTYAEWGSVYPPISFIFLELFSIGSCYGDSPLDGRECDPIGAWVLTAVTLFNVYLIYKNYKKADRRTAIPRTIAMGLGLPALFALERGNLIVPCFTFFILAHGNVLRSAWLRWVCFAVTVNFKIYLVVAIAGKLFRQKWRWVEGAAIATVLIYVVSFILFGKGTPLEVLGNIIQFTDVPDHLSLDYMEYATTYNSMLDLTKSLLPLMHFLGSRPLELVESIVPLVIKGGLLGVFACCAGAAWRPSALSARRIAALILVLFFTVTRSAGGYAEVFLFFLVFFEKWEGIARIMLLSSAYILSIPWDFMVVPIYHAVTNSYLSGRAVGYDFGVTLGAVLRPGLLLIMEYALVAASLIDIYRATFPKGEPSVGPAPDAYAHGAGAPTG